MTHRPEIGKNAWSAELAEGRLATESLRSALNQLIEDPGPQTRALLIAKAALALSKIEAVHNELDKIGREARNNGTTRTLKKA